MGKFDFSVIRNLRRKKGITADDLAGRAGVTRATIAKIERRDSNPTIDTIEAISAVFDLSASELLRLAEVAHCEEATTRTFREGDFDGTHVAFPNFELYHLRASPGAKKRSDPTRHENTAEVCLVLAGRVKVTVAGQAHELGPGMALRFKALHDHEYEVLEKSEMVMLHHRIV
ncbi:MAG: helix-turn-helix domain-containing protein [Thermodesulfobacteriota bacterium]